MLIQRLDFSFKDKVETMDTLPQIHKAKKVLEYNV